MKKSIFKRTAIASAVCSSAILSPVYADDIEHVEVTATRIQSKISDVPASIAVIDEKALKQLSANKLSDLLRYQPGVTVEKSGHRHGDANINIRGINGNRILVIKDGTIMPDGFGSAGVSQGRGNFDPFSLQQVEILKGPASALYGSNALGGVVLLKTVDPKQLLQRENESFYTSINTGYFSEDKRKRIGATVASEVSGGYMLAQMQHQSFSETDVNSDYKVNPKDGSADNVFVKWVFDSIENQKLQLTADYFNQETENKLNTNLGPTAGAPGTEITLATADDKSKVWRVGVQHELYDTLWTDTLKWQLDYQYSNYQQFEQEQVDNSGSAFPPIPPSSYFTDEHEDFEQKQVNVSVLGEKIVGDHHFLLGFDYLDKSVTRPIHRTEVDLLTNESTSIIDGYQHPGKTFPDADVTQLGIFAQDYFTVSDHLSFVMGVRYDKFKNTPNVDQAYQNFNVAGAVPKSYSDDAISPHVGMVYNFNEQTSVFANFTTGFRAPPIAEQYISRAILVPVPGVPHEVIPNNELESETSQGVELGIRWHNEVSKIEFSVYRNDFEDFIDSKTIGYREMFPMFVDQLAIRQIQYQNVDEVRIKGAELSGHLMLDTILPKGWRGDLHAALSVIDGENTLNGSGLNSVPGNTGVIGFSISPNEALTFNWHLRASTKADDAESLSQHGQPLPVFEPPGYGIQDLSIQYLVNNDFAISLSAYNITDKQYWGASAKGSDATGNLSSSVQPGRNFAVTASYQF
ncbi:TonB-dependent hemoglobin/transferrin/lactoferrin family receptor [Thalassotalea sp. 1_MG-2023]|uniref:TonB-dependent hemoglobin/transferrin/lactoferrin family receptor n=1 Tax=Thalassotalea sp. 1_MG-2023 TaxID=3062680 RepID=UPI0026E135E6|nr:TonB-dependent hemoglobin/transferrin/lactoferrin family receptor [Thalassotalea sp. 1_MG-2023]MDO6426687.1 TonB-dependent hemoglobin/transferrin/lactoferrin family receptor [Thalassotalea sp. 1_MG-2023]